MDLSLDLPLLFPASISFIFRVTFSSCFTYTLSLWSALHLLQLERVFHAPITYKISHVYALIHSFCTFSSQVTLWRNFALKGFKHGYEPLKTQQKLAFYQLKSMWNIHLSNSPTLESLLILKQYNKPSNNNSSAK